MISTLSLRAALAALADSPPPVGERPRRAKVNRGKRPAPLAGLLSVADADRLASLRSTTAQATGRAVPLWHRRGFVCGVDLSAPCAGLTLAIERTARIEGSAKGKAKGWRSPGMGRAHAGAYRPDRRNMPIGRQARTADTFDRVAELNRRELGIGRPAPETAAGFRGWLNARAATKSAAVAGPKPGTGQAVKPAKSAKAKMPAVKGSAVKAGSEGRLAIDRSGLRAALARVAAVA